MIVAIFGIFCALVIACARKQGINACKQNCNQGRDCTCTKPTSSKP